MSIATFADMLTVNLQIRKFCNISLNFFFVKGTVNNENQSVEGKDGCTQRHQVYSYICPFTHPLIHSFIHLFILTFIIIYPFIYSFPSTCYKENRIYIRVEFRESFGLIFFSPFQPEREFKVYKSCKCLQIICSIVH